LKAFRKKECTDLENIAVLAGKGGSIIIAKK
jgi:hypothetical protein